MPNWSKARTNIRVQDVMGKFLATLNDGDYFKVETVYTFVKLALPTIWITVRKIGILLSQRDDCTNIKPRIWMKVIG